MNRCNVLLANAFKSLACLVLLTSLLTAMLLAMVPSSGYAQEPKLTEQCVHFNDWKEGEYRAKFVKDDFIFTSLSDALLFISSTKTPEGAALGLQIPEGGVNIVLPQFASQVVLRYRTGTSVPVEVKAFTTPARDVVTYARTFPSEPSLVYSVNLPVCASFDIRGGGNEAILLEVCIEVESEQPVAEPFITRVEPAQGRCGSEMVLTVFGANFRSGLGVFIPEGVTTLYTEVISPEELRAGIFIAPDIPPGPRPVEIIDLESREPVAILEAGFTVVCPAPEPQGRPDLVLLWADWEIFGEDRLVITAEVANDSEVPVPQAVIHAESQTANWWAAEAIVPGLESGSSAEVRIELGIPDELRDMSHSFLVVVDPGGEIAELRVDNNWQDIEVWIGEGEPLFEPPDLIIPMAVLVVVAVIAMTLSIRRSRRIRRHRKCQEDAKEEEPPETCQPCTRYCRKIELELKPARRKIARLSLRTGETVSSESSKESELPDEIVAGLNKVITSRRQREEAVRLQGQIASLADRMLEHVMEWLRGEMAPKDVYISGHLVGGKVTCQFILYHCKRRGNMNVWEEEEKWKATMEDKRDEPVGMLGGLNPVEPKIPERLTSELTRLLTEFIGKV